MAFAALFTALGGTSYAALKITGANVANGTLTGYAGGIERKQTLLELEQDALF